MLGSMTSVLRFLFGFGAHAVEPDGFGQSILQDIMFARNFRMCRQTPVVWHVPATEEARALEVDPLIGRFGDTTIGMAQVAGRRWIVRERDWHGWPDPPRFVFFAMEGDAVWAGADFDRWPRRWQWPTERERAGICP
jgi:hypothetical protein